MRSCASVSLGSQHRLRGGIASSQSTVKRSKFAVLNQIVDRYSDSSGQRTARSRSLPRTRESGSLPKNGARPYRSPDLQQNLSHVLAGFHNPMGFRYVLHGNDTVDHHFDPTRFQQRPDVLTKILSDGSLFFDATGTQSRPRERQPSHHHTQTMELSGSPV